jgi:hypothetical protein
VVEDRWIDRVEEEHAYKTRQPTPYWPESGNSQMTCKTWLVVLVAVCGLLRLDRVSSTTADGSLGIVESVKRIKRLRVKAKHVGKLRLSICSDTSPKVRLRKRK